MYANADWAKDKETKKLIWKYVIFLNGTVIFGSLKHQTFVAQSWFKAKYITASKAVKKAVLIGCFLEKLYQIYIYPILLHCNN